MSRVRSLPVPVDRLKKRRSAWKNALAYLATAIAVLVLANFLAWPLLLVPDMDASLGFALASARAANPLEHQIFHEPMTEANCTRDVREIADYETHWLPLREFAGRPIRNHTVPVQVALLYREALYAGHCRSLSYVTAGLTRYRTVAHEDLAVRSLRDLPFHLPFSIFNPSNSLASAAAKVYAHALSTEQLGRGLCLARANRAGTLNRQTLSACLRHKIEPSLLHEAQPPHL